MEVPAIGAAKTFVKLVNLQHKLETKRFQYVTNAKQAQP